MDILIVIITILCCIIGFRIGYRSTRCSRQTYDLEMERGEFPIDEKLLKKVVDTLAEMGYKRKESKSVATTAIVENPTGDFQSLIRTCIIELEKK